MYACWNIDSKLRPAFDALEAKISILLHGDITLHYISLNESYLKMNPIHGIWESLNLMASAVNPDYETPMASMCPEIQPKSAEINEQNE